MLLGVELANHEADSSSEAFLDEDAQPRVEQRQVCALRWQSLTSALVLEMRLDKTLLHADAY